MSGADTRNRQMETAECGLAAMAMAASMAGSKISLAWLRQRFPISQRGSTVKDLVEIASSIGMSTRAVRCELEELQHLRRPSILHWGLNHFVVLDKVKNGKVRIFDPAKGYCTLSMGDASRRFSGVALELTVTASFERRAQVSPLRLSGMITWTSQLRGGLLQALILSILMQAYVVAAPYYMQLGVDEVAMKGDLGLLGALAIGFAIFALFNAVSEGLRGVVLQRISSLLSWDMSQRLFHHMVRLPLPWFQKRRLADAQSRFQALDPVKSLIANGLVSAIIDGALSLVTVIMMLIYSPILALVAVVGVLLYFTVRIASIPISRRYAADALVASIAEQGKRLETLRAIQTIKVMGGEAQREGEWANKFADTIRSGQANTLVTAWLGTLQKFLDAIVNIIIVYIGIADIVAGKMTIGILYAFIAYRGQFSARAISLFEVLTAWKLLDVYTNRLADAVLTPVEAGLDKTLVGASDIVGRIELRRVGFQYGPNDPIVLKNVSAIIEPGQFVAIAGPSGVGKSTLLKILCGLYTPSSGEIYLDGLPLSTWGPRAVRSVLGVVMQDDELLPGSIADNVSFFDDHPDVDRIWTCLKQVAFDQEVRAMPMRADTFVGDMGSTLSGGQKQRILLARALYKQPKILVLDEATSHLDIGRERSINAVLSELKITRIIVAHRPETIRTAQRVMQLKPDGLFEYDLQAQGSLAPS